MSTPLSLLAAVDLNSGGTDSKPVYQFVYSSELYGTAFGIYARFKGTESSSSYQISALSLQLVNYRGVINIGFAKNDLIYKSNAGKNLLFCYVQGAAPALEKEYTFDAPVAVDKGKPFPLTFIRKLLPLPGFEKDFGPVDLNGKFDQSTPQGQYFDSEFYYRNGVDFYRQPLKPGLNGFDNLEVDAPPIPSPRCHEGNLILVY
jgi:hypothetical protein